MHAYFYFPNISGPFGLNKFYEVVISAHIKKFPKTLLVLKHITLSVTLSDPGIFSQLQLELIYSQMVMVFKSFCNTTFIV